VGVVFAGHECVDPSTLWQHCQEAGLPTARWFGKANKFVCPLGAEAGRGHLLMRRGDIDAVNHASTHHLKFTSLTNGTNHRTATLQSLVVVAVSAAIPGVRGDADAYALVEIADRRYRYKHIPVDAAYNLRSTPGGSYYSGTLNTGVAWTWTQIAEQLWNAVGVTRLGTYPGLPFTPHGTPDGWEFWQQSAIDALHLFLDRLGCRLKLNVTTDAFSIVRVGSDDADYDKATTAFDRRRLWEEECDEAVKGSVPQYVRVIFPKQPVTPGSSPWYAVDVTDPTGSPETDYEAGSYVIVQDDLPAIYDTSAVLTNSATLSARATDRATDFFRALREGTVRMNVVYEGAISDPGLVGGSLVNRVAWYDVGNGVKTEVARTDDGMLRPDSAPRVSGGPQFRLVVEESDNNPKYEDINWIQFNDGHFNIEQPAVGKVKINWDGMRTSKNGGASTNPRPKYNLIEGAGISITLADDAGNDETDITIANAVSNGDISSHRHYASGYYQTSHVWGDHFAGAGDPVSNLTADRLYFTPFVAGRDFVADEIGIYVGTTSGSHNCRVGLYAAFADQDVIAPGALLVDAGVISLGAAGWQTIGINQSLTSGAMYWLAVVFDSVAVGPTIRQIRPSGMWPFAWTETGGFAEPVVGWYMSHTYAALPSVGSLTPIAPTSATAAAVFLRMDV
jgi:hypothetical protein